MKQIHSFSISQLRDEEDYGFHLIVQEEAKYLPGQQVMADTGEEEQVVLSQATADGNTRALTSVIAIHAEAVRMLDIALKEANFLISVTGINSTDMERNNAWTSSIIYLKAMILHPNAEIRAVSEELYELFMQYDDPIKLSPMEKNDIFHNLIQDVNAMDRTKIELISFSIWKERIETSHANYLNAAKKCTVDKMEHIMGWVKEVRKKADLAFKQFVAVVNSHSIVFGDAPYETFIDHLNTQISNHKAILKARKTKVAKL